MQIKETALSAHCKNNGLLSIYWISGDDALQRLETADVIRKKAKSQGFRREIISLSAAYDWNIFTEQVQHGDLFGEKILFEIQTNSGKFDKQAQAAIEHYLTIAPEDKRLLIVSHKLTASQKKSKWHKKVDGEGGTVYLWPPSRLALPKWVEERLAKKQLKADVHAVSLLAVYCEGDLSTAHQAIEKLALLQPEQPIEMATVRAMLSDHSNYNPFDCVDAALAGQPKRCLRLLDGLKHSNQEKTLLLWAISQQIKLLYDMRYQIDHGAQLKAVISGQWQKRQPLLTSALRRLNLQTLGKNLSKCRLADRAIKGLSHNDPWHTMQSLLLNVATGEG